MESQIISVSPDECLTVTRVWKGFRMNCEFTGKQKMNQETHEIQLLFMNYRLTVTRDPLTF